MKRLLLFCILPVYTHCWQYYSFAEHKYTTSISLQDIDEQKYHELSCVVGVLWRELTNCHMTIKQRMEVIEKYLLTLKDPAALRLLEDLQQIMN